jgi:hypothetical protein
MIAEEQDHFAELRDVLDSESHGFTVSKSSPSPA